jgi:hypothetical protein
MKGHWPAALLLALLVILLPREAAAHGRSTSWSTVAVRGGEVEIRLRLSRLDLSAVPAFTDWAARAGDRAGDDGALADYLTGHLRAETSAGPCEVDRASYGASDPRAASEGFVARSWRARCRGDGLRLVANLLFDEVPSHLHFAAVRREDGDVAECVLTHDARVFPIGEGAAAARPAGLRAFVALGARHVASGADHLVFLLSLLAGARSLRGLVTVVTGFTLGHSATLALAVLGAVRPSEAAVEALVGASIAVVAVENVWLERRDPWLPRALVAALGAVAILSLLRGQVSPLATGGAALFVACYFGLLARSDRPERLRWIVAALFGTVHGFAFSGTLAEMGLPRARLLSSLLGFNAGVEIGQLAVVALAWPVFRLLARTRARERATLVASVTALAAGTAWLVGRAFG